MSATTLPVRRRLTFLVTILLLAGGAQAFAAGSSTDGKTQFLIIGVSAMLMMLVLGGIAWTLRMGVE